MKQELTLSLANMILNQGRDDCAEKNGVDSLIYLIEKESIQGKIPESFAWLKQLQSSISLESDKEYQERQGRLLLEIKGGIEARIEQGGKEEGRRFTKEVINDLFVLCIYQSKKYKTGNTPLETKVFELEKTIDSKTVAVKSNKDFHHRNYLKKEKEVHKRPHINRLSYLKSA